jgi:hypothetical protein
MTMTFPYFWFLRARWIAAVVLAALAGPAASAAPLLTPDEIRVVESHMSRDEARVRARLGAYAGFIAGHERVDLGRLSIPSFDAVECVLQRAIDRSLTSPQLFSDPMFARDGALSLFVDRDVLVAIDREFDLHSVFLIEPRPHDGGGSLTMAFFLIGQGVLEVRYPRAGTFDHPDRAFRVSVPLFGSSRTYEVAPLIRMDIVDGGAPGFEHLATLSDPTARPEDFVGPWNASIRSIAVRGNKIDVRAHLVFGRTETLEIPRIERRPGHIPDMARLRALGCPSGAPWGQGG